MLKLNEGDHGADERTNIVEIRYVAFEERTAEKKKPLEIDIIKGIYDPTSFGNPIYTYRSVVNRGGKKTKPKKKSNKTIY